MAAHRVLLALLLAATAARADSHKRFGGLKASTIGEDPDNLPPPLPAQGCFTLGQQRLSAAATAYRARFHGAKEGGTVTRQVHGVTLTDTERAIGYLERALGKKPPDAWSRAGEANCTKVLCALQKTLGDLESALWLMVAAAEVDAPPSLDQSPYDVESVWEQHELRALARALLEAPPELKRVTTLKAWRRLPSGQKLRKGAWYNAVSYPHDPDYDKLGTIVIKDTVWKFPQRSQREVVLHELGHHWEFSRKAEGDKPHSLSEEWLSFSGWVPKPGGVEGRDFVLSPGMQIATAGESIPGEDFADSIANYRFAPRLMRAYSKSKYEYMHKLFGKEHRRPEPDPQLEAAWNPLGGPLKSLRACAAHIQRATFGPKLHQAELYVVLNRPTGGTHWEPVPRNQFVIHGGCVDQALKKLEAAPEWAAVECRQDPEDIAVMVADRLEDAWASWAEAADAIREAVPPSTAQGCLDHKELNEKCFAGARGETAAEREAGRILGELAGGDQSDRAALAQALLVQTPLVPSDEELRERYPVLKSPPDLFYACLRGAAQIYRKQPTAPWLFAVDLADTHEQRGFKDPLWQPNCSRDFAAHLGEAGFKVDAADALFEHFTYLLKNQSQGLIDQFASRVLSQSKTLRCGDAACTARWLKPRLAGLAPPGLVDDLAAHVAGTLKPK